MTRPGDDPRRDLDRLEREREKLFHGSPSADNDDGPYERLGKRIARILSLVMVAAALVYLLLAHGR
ncbi:MAG: hypothetical protein U1F47_00380 [Hyphomicrobiales bacterium]